MLDSNLKAQLQAYLQRITQPVEIRAALDDTDVAREMTALLQDVAAASSLLSISYTGESEGGDSAAAARSVSTLRRPSFTIGRPGEATRIRFAGLPMGHEFTSLVLALLQAGGHAPKADAASLQSVRELDGDFEFETYVSLECQNCPDVVQALNLMAVLNPRIRHTMIDGALFQSEVEARQIMSVPSVYLNGKLFGQGRMSLQEIVAKLDSGAVANEIATLSARAPYDVLVVGGGPAGAAAAIYAARKGIRTGVAAERFGGQVLDTLGIQNFISVKETEGPRMAAALEEHVRSYDVDIMNLQRAESLTAGDLFELKFASGAALRAKSIVIATGARWRELGVPGEREYRNRGVAYCPHCDGPLFKGKQVAVVGGGNSGVEAAIDLAGIVAHVSLIEFDPQLRADAVLIRKLRSLANVTIITNAQTTGISGDGQRVRELCYKDRHSGALHAIELAGVFVQIGLVPNTDWLKGTVKLSARGEIEVDARGETSVPGIFAAGDCTTTPYKQIVIAMGAGATAALGAFDHLIRSSVPASVAAIAAA